VRWQQLFDDLEGQLAAAEAAELASEVSERTRIEHGRIRLADRVRAGLGTEVVVGCGVDDVRGRLVRVTPDAVVVAEIGGAAVVPLAALAWVSGLDRAASAPREEGPMDRGLGLRMLLRAIARDRSPVRILFRDRSSLAGTIDAVGSDWLDLAVHPLGEPRRAGVSSLRTVRIDAMAVIREGQAPGVSVG